ncbi:MAG: helix-turn-helix domain-containing protein [Clostridia bacterium]|nr:helix-turn-helix domain-containing protein [Clostridia bacterium]
MKVSEILKNLRTESGLTQKELSDKLNIGQATIACYENGKRDPHIFNLIAYADFFECTLDFLVGRSDDLGNIVVDINKTKSNKYTVSQEEYILLSKYKKLNDTAKNRLIGYIDGLLE